MTRPLTGTGAGSGWRSRTVLGRFVAVRGARSGLVWGVAFAGYTAAQVLAYTSAYPSPQSRSQLEAAYGSNVGLNALFGPAHGIDTITGYSAWRLLGVLGLLGSIWGLLIATRLVRGEEEAGRTELLLAGPISRRGAAVQAALGLGVALGVLFLLTGLGTVLTGRSHSVGFSLSAAVYFALTLVSGAAVFLALGLLAGQLAATRRQAAGLAGAAFGAAYGLRMIADADPSVHWLVWLTPLGWIEESRPLTGSRPLALVPVALLVAGAVGSAVLLAGRRDLATGLFGARDRRAPALALLGGPIGLAVRLARTSTISWFFGVIAFGLLIGSLAESSTKDAAGSKGIEQALARLGGHGRLVEIYLGLTMLALAGMLGFLAAGLLGAIRTEETQGRLENLLVRPLSRARWLAGRVLVAVLALVLAGALGGLSAFLGAASQHSGVGLWPLVAAGVNLVPSAVFLLCLGVLCYGCRPRWAAAVVYGYLGWSMLIEFLGGVVQANHWLMDTSIYFHLAPAPATDPNLTSTAVILALSALGGIGGLALLSRRDLVTSD